MNTKNFRVKTGDVFRLFAQDITLVINVEKLSDNDIRNCIDTHLAIPKFVMTLLITERNKTWISRYYEGTDVDIIVS